MSAFDLSAFNPSADNLGEIVSMARVAEASERYEDMCAFMKFLVESKCKDGSTLSTEERNLFSVAYKNVIGTRRASWRTLKQNDEHKTVSDFEKRYQKVIEDELVATCGEVLKLLDLLLETPEAKLGKEAQVFYLKMAGDYYRYLAESTSSSGNSHPQNAADYYKRAYEAATTEGSSGEDPLAPTHPIRLGLALNYSVCHYEILQDKDAACELAKQAFDDAISKLDKLEETDYKDSTLIMQLLRDNLTLWKSSAEGESEVQVEDLSDDEN